MSYDFRDSFDLYAAIGDLTAGKWDTGNTFLSLQSGRFGRALSVTGANQASLVSKSSGQNDTVHHLHIAFFCSDNSNPLGWGLFDGTTAQCTIAFTTTGAIQLQSGALGGAVLATYSNAWVVNVWNQYEFEVVINNTTGSFTVRTQGATSNSFQATGLNTRTSANNYANKLQLQSGGGTNGNNRFDDLIWRSDPSSLSWLGDQRSYTLYPASDSSVQFSRSPASTTITPFSSPTTAATANGTARYGAFTAIYDGTVGTIQLPVATGYTGNMKCTIFSSVAGAGISGQQPGTVLGSATAIANPATGTNSFTFGTPVAVTRNTQYWVGFDFDSASGSISVASSASTGLTSTTAYASFPVATPTVVAGNQAPNYTVVLTPTTNYQMTNEAQQDGTTTYVWDSTVGHSDLYAIQQLPSSLVAPSSISGVVTRAFIAKSDAGARSAQSQIRTHGTTYTSGALSLSTSFQWVERNDVVNPQTGVAWTVSDVNAATIGANVQA